MILYDQKIYNYKENDSYEMTQNHKVHALVLPLAMRDQRRCLRLRRNVAEITRSK